MDHYAFVSELKDWIEKNHEHANKIDDIAEKSGYSKWHLQRLFQKFTGENLGEYLRSRRLHRAAEALINTNTSIIEISLSCGFGSQQSFTRAFKHYFNCTPAKYRRVSFPGSLPDNVTTSVFTNTKCIDDIFIDT